MYGQCNEKIGNFNDTEYFVTMLNRVCCPLSSSVYFFLSYYSTLTICLTVQCEDKGERDRLLQFLHVVRVVVDKNFVADLTAIVS